MKIGIDLSPLSFDKAGIGYYTEKMAESLFEFDKSNDYYVFTNEKNTIEQLKFLPKDNAIELKSSLPNFLWMLKVVSYLKRNKFDYFISSSNFMFGFLFPNTIQYVHDLTPIKYPGFVSKKASMMYKYQLKLCLRRVKYVATISNAVKDEIIQLNPKYAAKIFFAGMGINDSVTQKVSEELKTSVKKKYNLPSQFILSLSTLQPRKNYVNMIKAFSIFSRNYPDYKYVIVGGKGWYFDEIFDIVKKLNLEDKVLFLGYTPEVEVAGIYELASAFMFMSFYEGFGMPPLEAYIKGLPVLVSDIPVMREVMQDKAVFANPNDVKDIAEKLLIVLTKKQTVDTKFLEQYSWKRVSERITSLLS